LCFVAKAFLYVSWTWLSEFTGAWSRFWPADWKCEHPPLPANQSGVRVLVAGFQGTGSEDVLEGLRQLGLGNVHTSDAFKFFVWSDVRDAYWLRRAGGRWGGTPLPGSPLDPGALDQVLIGDLPVSELAAAISSCRVDAVAADGIVAAAHLVRRASPGVKVLLLSQGSYWELQRKHSTAAAATLQWLLPFGVLFGAQSALPWIAALPFLDRHIGGQAAERAFKQGRQHWGRGGVGSEPFTFTLAKAALVYRRALSAYFCGLHVHPPDEQTYSDFFEGMREAVPEHSLLEWDFERHTYEDLCELLATRPCPLSGRIPRGIGADPVPWFTWSAYAPFVVLALLTHWANWKIIGLLFSWMCCRCKVRDKPRLKVE